MREILFRGKRIDNGEWVYGSLVIQSGEWLDKDEKAPDEYFIYGKRGEIYLVDSSTVGQYTGVNDKNDKKIFDGDIVKNYFSKRFDPIVGRVAFDDRYCRLRLYSCTGGSESGFYRGCVYEVIGNIYDNSELLKGE